MHVYVHIHDTRTHKRSPPSPVGPELGFLLEECRAAEKGGMHPTVDVAQERYACLTEVKGGVVVTAPSLVLSVSC